MEPFPTLTTTSITTTTTTTKTITTANKNICYELQFFEKKICLSKFD